MRRYFENLRPADRSAIDSAPDGLFLVRVDRAQYRWHAQKTVSRKMAISMKIRFA
ncbi:MAG TPA: hypothetical protein VGV15_09700 [Terriglobales bacterium]|nr:hypothetical protein [Terriglobales bacterium]